MANAESSEGRKLIVFELNEVPYRVIDWYATARPRSNLARSLRSFAQYETLAADTGDLSPWITWPTLHRGVNDSHHGIFQFGQDRTKADRAYPAVWSLLADAGVSCGIFNSLHTHPLPAEPERFAFWVPDPFAPTEEAHPASLRSFQRLNLAMSRASARNVDTSIPWSLAGRFLADAPRLGVRPATATAVARQLVDERRRPPLRARRRTFQSILAFDLYDRLLRRRRPAFTTYFTNHVASAMHRFWAATFDGDYEEFGLSDRWVESFRDEIGFAMDWADRFLGRLLGFVRENPEYLLVVASSMGQAATLARGAQTQFQLEDLGRFMRLLGVPDAAWERRPAMLPDVNFLVKPEYVENVRERFGEVEVLGKPLQWREAEGGFFHLVFGTVDADVSEGLRIAGERHPVEEGGFRKQPIDSGTGKATAYHVPEGIFMVHDPRNPTPRRGRPRRSVLQVAPAILRSFGVSPPDYMEPDAAPLAHWVR